MVRFLLALGATVALQAAGSAQAEAPKADPDPISRLPDDGPFVAYNHPLSPREGALMLDVGHLVRQGSVLTTSWLLLPAPETHAPGYERDIYTADCKARRGARVAQGVYDDKGVLVRTSGPERFAGLASMGGFGRVLTDLCFLEPNPSYPTTYPNVAAALAAGRAMLVREP